MAEAYYSTADLFDMGVIPEEYRGKILERCPDCGSEIIRTRNLTQAKCYNSVCYEHMKHRADFVLKHLNIKNIGPETCKSYLSGARTMNHLKIIPMVLETKPKVKFWEVVYLMQMEGYASQAKTDLLQYEDIDDYIANCPDPNPLLVEYQDSIRRNQGFFELIKAQKGTVVEVMLNGSFEGFTKRSDLLLYINAKYGDYVQFKETSGPKASAMFCVTENPTSSARKVALARKEGIPIVSPLQLLQVVMEIVKKKGGEV